MKVYVEEGCKIPSKENKTDSGWDIHSKHPSFYIGPNERQVVSTGVWVVDIPEGYDLQIQDKSGLAAKHGITILAGVVDNGYRGELKVVMLNTGDKSYHVRTGDKIAQIVLRKVNYEEVMEAAVEKNLNTSRGANGFGSTGTT